MKIVSISDTHNKHRYIEKIPDGDVLIHAGDITKRGEIAVLDDFAHWMKDLPFKWKVFISGNHDLSLEWETDQKREILKLFQECGLIYLQNSSVEIEGVHFYGSPHTPIWHNRWAFNLPRRGKELKQQWAAIPEQTNVLITHGPPYQILDKAPRGVFDYEHSGCVDLAKRIRQLPHLKAHIFGHIHDDYGTQEKDGVMFLNSAICNEKYHPNNLPHSFEI